jgi:hypothetical protein
MHMRQVKGDGSNQFSSTSATPMLRASGHKVSLCYANGSFSTWRDGTRTMGPTAGNTVPASVNILRVGDLGPSSFQWGQGIQEVCISGPSATPTGTDPVTAVASACGEFTVVDPGPCYGCVTPAAGATKVLVLGNSIEEGAAMGLARPLDGKLNSLLGASWAVTNGGQGGFTISQIKSKYETLYRYVPSTTTLQTWPWVVVGGSVINDIGRDGATAETTWTTAEALFNMLRADGRILVLARPLPFGGSAWWDSTKQGELDEYLALLDAYCQDHLSSTPAVKCVDPVPLLASGSPLTLTQSTDKIHPTQSESDTYATTIRTAFP